METFGLWVLIARCSRIMMSIHVSQERWHSTLRWTCINRKPSLETGLQHRESANSELDLLLNSVILSQFARESEQRPLLALLQGLRPQYSHLNIRRGLLQTERAEVSRLCYEVRPIMLEYRKREEESSWMSESPVCAYTFRPSKCLLARAKAEAYSDILSALGYTIGFGSLLLGRRRDDRSKVDTVRSAKFPGSMLVESEARSPRCRFGMGSSVVDEWHGRFHHIGIDNAIPITQVSPAENR